MNQSVIRTMTDRTMAPQIQICSAIAWVYLRSLSEAASEPETSLRLRKKKIRSAIAWVYLRSLSEAASEPETSLRLPR